MDYTLLDASRETRNDVTSAGTRDVRKNCSQNSFQMEQMEFHQHSHLFPTDGPEDQFAEIYNQASFFFTLTQRRLQLWEPGLKRGGTTLKNRAISSKYSSADKSSQGQAEGRLLD